MFCPKCGSYVEGPVCDQCGCNFADFENSATSAPEASEQEQVYQEETNSQTYVYQEPPVPETDAAPHVSMYSTLVVLIKPVIFCLIGLIVLIMFFIAASEIASGGLGIIEIQSVGKKTLEEAYYLQIGGIYGAYAMIARALGIFLASAAVWMGFKKW